MKQVDYMRELVTRHGHDAELVCRLYAAGERAGIVTRKSNMHAISAEAYAAALYKDGIRKGWL